MRSLLAAQAQRRAVGEVRGGRGVLRFSAKGIGQTQRQQKAQGDPVIRDTTTENFTQDVVTESWRQPVLVDFWAEWCGPCRWLAPVLAQAVRAAGGKVKLVKLNIDHYPEIPGKMGVNAIPTVIAFVDGEPADGFSGARSGTEVRAFIERIIRDAAPPEVIPFRRESATASQPSAIPQHTAPIEATLPQPESSSGSVEQDNPPATSDSPSMRPVLAMVILTVIVLVTAVVVKLLN